MSSTPSNHMRLIAPTLHGISTQYSTSAAWSTCAELHDSFPAGAGGRITLTDVCLIWKMTVDGKLHSHLFWKPLTVQEHLFKLALICTFKMLPRTFSILVSASVWYRPFRGTNSSSKSHLWLQYTHTRKINTSLYQPQGNTSISSQGVNVCVKQPNHAIVFLFWGYILKCYELACTGVRGDKINHSKSQTWLLKMCIHPAQIFSVTQTTKLPASPSNVKISNSFWKGGY